MKVNIRLYKLHDSDLVALADAGYPLKDILHTAIIKYANGVPYHIYIDEYVPYNMTDKTGVRLQVSIPESEKNAIYLLRHVKSQYRNVFCKTLLRNCFIQQNLIGMFSDMDYGVQLQNANANGIDILSFPGLQLGSAIRKDRVIDIDFLGTSVTKKKGVGIKAVPGAAPQISTHSHVDDTAARPMAKTPARKKTPSGVKKPTENPAPFYSVESPVAPAAGGASLSSPVSTTPIEQAPAAQPSPALEPSPVHDSAAVAPSAPSENTCFKPMDSDDMDKVLSIFDNMERRTI